MTVDTVSDVLTRIRNACLAEHAFVEVPETKLSKEVVKIIYKEKFIRNIFFGVEKGSKKFMLLFLVYERGYWGTNTKSTKSKIRFIKRVSSPGCRVYKGYKDLKPVDAGYGFSIVSTSQGLLTDKEARERKVGGEVLCEVY